MKIGTLGLSVIGLSLICSSRADDLPRMGYIAGTPVKDLVAKGYRWTTVNGPYASFGWSKMITPMVLRALCVLLVNYQKDSPTISSLFFQSAAALLESSA